MLRTCSRIEEGLDSKCAPRQLQRGTLFVRLLGRYQAYPLIIFDARECPRFSQREFPVPVVEQYGNKMGAHRRGHDQVNQIIPIDVPRRQLQPALRSSDPDRRFFTRAQLQSNGIERVQCCFTHDLHRCQVWLLVAVKIRYGEPRGESARSSRSSLRRLRRISTKRHYEHTETKQAQARPRHAGNLAFCAKASTHERLIVPQTVPTLMPGLPSVCHQLKPVWHNKCHNWV